MNKKNKILIVEDDLYIRDALNILLESEGYEIVCAANGHEALVTLNASNTLPALILLDIMMPVKDGYQFYEEQCQDPRIADIPIIVLSAVNDIEANKHRINALAYIKKPIDIESLIKAVSIALNVKL